jgi:hypothetical protein
MGVMDVSSEEADDIGIGIDIGIDILLAAAVTDGDDEDIVYELFVDAKSTTVLLYLT